MPWCCGLKWAGKNCHTLKYLGGPRFKESAVLRIVSLPQPLFMKDGKKYAMITSFHTLSNSLFINRPVTSAIKTLNLRASVNE
jgi:hypothetical protein